MGTNVNDGASNDENQPSPPSSAAKRSNEHGNSADAASDKGRKPSSNGDSLRVVEGNISDSTVYPHSPVISYMSVQHQPSRGYYAYQQNGTTPNSPAITTPSAGYDMQGLMYCQQHQTAGLGTNVMTRQHFTNIPPPPPSLSPVAIANGNTTVEEVSSASMGLVAPPSPLFPGPSMSFLGTNSERMDSSNPASIVAPTSPSLQYIHGHPSSPAISGYAGAYVGYGSGSNPPNSPENRSSWTERPSQQHLYQNAGNSPLIQTQTLPMHYQGGPMQNRRTASFDDMLPPPATVESPPDDYSGTSMTGNTSWGFNGLEPYGLVPPNQQSFRQRSIVGRPEQSSLPPNIQSFYPATTPGPPIQTTHHNKGPDGANLFIFHIPNHFTNMDMWNLFCHYGNLLSVRIMVEKDTGRSRGFGFVSYDSPDAAAMAIKELNGFVVGNKRLKVQHKQIRHSENPSTYQRTGSTPTYTASNGSHNVNSTHTEHETVNMIGEPWLRVQANVANESSITASDENFLGAKEDNLSLHPSSTVECSDVSTAAEQNGRAFTRLNQIRDALPTIEK